MSEHEKAFVILTPGFPKDEADSTCLPFPQLFVKTLKQLHPSMNIIVLSFQYPFIKKEYDWHGVKVVAFGGRSKGKLFRLITWSAVWRKLNTIVKQYEVTGILNFWLGECGLIGKHAARKHKLPSFTWLLGQDARANNHYFSLIKPDTKNLIALSDAIAGEFYRNYGKTPAHIVPPGIDMKNNNPAYLKSIDILGAGSLIPLKRYDIFISVVAKIAATHPSIKAIICGSGPEMQRLQKLIEQKNLSPNIELVGELDHETVIALMQRAKIFLHPSSYEGFATVYSEALYAGAHVVGFCRPMITRFKHLHIVNTEIEMTDTINLLLRDKNLSHESVVTWPIEETCKKIVQLYGM